MKQHRRSLAFLLCSLLLLSALIGCAATPEEKPNIPLAAAEELRAAVLYDGQTADGSWADVLSRLEQPLLLNFSAEALDSGRADALSGFDLVYADESLLSAENPAALAETLMDFVERGGALFLTNGFHSFFPKDFLGAAGFEKITALPEELKFPELGEDLAELQQIISDFSKLYAQYPDSEARAQYDYGYGVKPGTATALVTAGGLALYTMNEYGAGQVFFTNPLLPNTADINGFSLTSRNEAQTALSNTTASGNQLLENAFASYISKQRWGYSLYRVFGSLGRPSMAWELHYEEITGFQNDAGILFGELCRESSQVPGYTLIRNTYWWFLRAESVSYLLGEKGENGAAYTMDYYESAYSSGTHVVAGEEWLSLARLENAGSYFVDYEEFTQRAYPDVVDLDGDGLLDIICGSSDGRLYFYKGEGFHDRFKTGYREYLTDSAGRPLLVESYSAPAAVDVNGDGVLDLISGCADGKLYWFSGNGDLTFEYQGLLNNCLMPGQSLPAVGDLNGDGRQDLIVGSGGGELTVWYGKSEAALETSEGLPLVLPADLGKWLAPSVADLDGDGKNDLAIGTEEGYIARLLSKDGLPEFAGYLTLNEKNYKGNANAKFGNNCVPCFADLNGDGTQDLIAGSLEYGLAYPIDSPYYPYYEQLQKSVDYITDNGFYLGVHFYTNEYASPERERAELSYHLAAMEKRYGVSFGPTGVNHHTWYSSTGTPTQSLLSAWEAGLLWNSGFSPAKNGDTAPQVSAQNVISLPFFLTVDGERTILVQNCATLLYSDSEWTDISARYGMPVCIYYHCDFAYQNEEAARENIRTAEAFRRKHAYNFVGEDQLMLATAAAYHLGVSLEATAAGVTITPSALATDFPLYQAAYQNSCGLRISLGEKLAHTALSVDADVWSREGNTIYASLNRPLSISLGERAGTHLQQVNLPAELSTTDSGAEIKFRDGGMMQVTVAGSAETSSEGWTKEAYDGFTVFTKYGAADTITITFD